MSRKQFTPKRHAETAFTLVEIVIVAVIIGILALIGVNYYAGQQKAAIKATVKHDLMTNKSLVADPLSNGDHLYLPYHEFMDVGVRTSDNILGYAVNKTGTEACTFSAHRFNENEIFTYHYSTKTGTIAEGLCESLDDTGYVEPPTDESESETPPVEYPGLPDPEEIPTPAVPITKMENGVKPGNGVTDFTTRITTNNFYRACMEITITTNSDTPVPWEIVLDRTEPPFKDNYVDNNGEGDFTIIEHPTHMNVHGNSTVKNATKTKPVIFNLCVPAPGTQPIDREVKENKSIPNKQVQGGSWYAYQDFQIESDSTFYSNWTTELDLTDLIKKADKQTAKPRIDVGQLKLVHVNGNKYRLTNSTDGYLSTRESKPATITIRIG